jgi:hypothetical protein
MRAEMARLTLARKIAAIALTIWKKGETVRSEEAELDDIAVLSGFAGNPKIR